MSYILCEIAFKNTIKLYNLIRPTGLCTACAVYIYIYRVYTKEKRRKNKHYRSGVPFNRPTIDQSTIRPNFNKLFEIPQATKANYCQCLLFFSTHNNINCTHTDIHLCYTSPLVLF